MRHLARLTLVGCLLPAFAVAAAGQDKAGQPAPPAPQVTTTTTILEVTRSVGAAESYYNGRAGYSHVVTRLPRLSTDADASVGLVAAFRVDGRALRAPDGVRLLFSSASPRYHGERELVVSYDGREVRLGKTNVARGALMWDSTAPEVSFETFKQIAGSKKVQVRLGDEALDLSGRHLAALRDLVKIIGAPDLTDEPPRKH